MLRMDEILRGTVRERRRGLAVGTVNCLSIKARDAPSGDGQPRSKTSRWDWVVPSFAFELVIGTMKQSILQALLPEPSGGSRISSASVRKHNALAKNIGSSPMVQLSSQRQLHTVCKR